MGEMETGSESIESGVESGASSDASESESSTKLSQTDSIEQKQDTTPFHEHPRFKELVEQKNSYAKELESIRAQNKAFEQQLSSFKDSQPKPPSETDALLKDLKQIDPRLASAIEKTLKAAEIAEANKTQFEQYQQQTQEQARQQTLANAVGKINSLHESNKMSEFGKQFINNQLDLAYRGGQLNASDLKAVESAYSEASKVIKSYEDNLKRDLTKSYVESKQKDAAVPASVPKGTQPRAKETKLPAFKSKDDLRSAVVKSYLKSTAQEKAANNT